MYSKPALDYAKEKAVEAKDAEIERLREALREIAHMEPGSRGAFKKFFEAQRTAQRALDNQ